MTSDDIREHAIQHGISIVEAKRELEIEEIKDVISTLCDKKLRIIFNYIMERLK